MRGYPFWRVSASAAADGGAPDIAVDEGRGAPLVQKELGCAQIVAEVVRSGKQGLGIIAVDHSPPDCPIRVVAIRLKIGPTFSMQRPAPGWDAERSTYVGFELDNEALWNQGQRTGELDLQLTGASQGTLSFYLHHAYMGAHERTPMGSWPIPPHSAGHDVVAEAFQPDAGSSDGGAAP